MSTVDASCQIKQSYKRRQPLARIASGWRRVRRMLSPDFSPVHVPVAKAPATSPHKRRRSTSQAFVCAFDEDADASTAACACAVDVAACAEELPESAGDAAERVAMAERRAEAADLSVRVLSRHVELLREQLSKEQTRSADFKLACKRTKQRCYRMISAGRTRSRARAEASTACELLCLLLRVPDQ